MNPKLTINTITKAHEPIRMLSTIRKSSLGVDANTSGKKGVDRTGPVTNAVMAGGAIYDLFTGVWIKDYDIFVQVDAGANINEQTIATALKISTDGAGSVFGDSVIEEIEPANDGGYQISKYVKEVWNVEHGAYTYQLVFLNMNPIEYIEKYFDLGICKAWCDGAKLHYTADCMKDINEKTITICDAKFSRKHFDYVIRNHLVRVRRKYPGHTVVVHSANDAYVTDKNKKYLYGAPSIGWI